MKQSLWVSGPGIWVFTAFLVTHVHTGLGSTGSNQGGTGSPPATVRDGAATVALSSNLLGRVFLWQLLPLDGCHALQAQGGEDVSWVCPPQVTFPGAPASTCTSGPGPPCPTLHLSHTRPVPCCARPTLGPSHAVPVPR